MVKVEKIMIYHDKSLYYRNNPGIAILFVSSNYAYFCSEIIYERYFHLFLKQFYLYIDFLCDV